ncbi:hypothetical protein B0H10DRAFT_1939274 [Mycena sp. CBHHK59/15]|nr:hypothetical protein B0H10DRAFT_1939274 [Mycena sp. CBHHK59/15]
MAPLSVVLLSLEILPTFIGVHVSEVVYTCKPCTILLKNISAPLFDLSFTICPIQVEILVVLTRLILAPSSPYTLSINARLAVHFVHSFSSYITAGLTSKYPELTQVILLSGFSGVTDHNILIAGEQSRIMVLLDPVKWGHLQTGYVTSVDLYADSHLSFKHLFFDHVVTQWSTGVKSPYVIGELATASQLPYDMSNFSKPVQVFQGRYDLPACGGSDCDGVLNGTALLWPSANPLNITGTFNAGHLVNLHFNTSQVFAVMLNFIAKNT